MSESVKRCRTCRHWHACPLHERAEPAEIARRVADFKARGVAGTLSRYSQPGEPCG